MLDKGYVYPQKFPGFCTDLPHSNWQFFRLIPETLSRFFRQTTEKHKRVLIPPTAMTNRWQFDITMTQVEDLERNCIRNICF